MMRFLLKTAFFLLLPLALFFYTGCGGSDDEPDYSDPRGQQLSSLYNNAVAPGHAVFVAESQALQTAVTSFVVSPSATTLAEARSAWRTTTRQWKRTEVYDFGRVSNFFLHTRIHRWPVDPEGILENIATDESIDEAYISSKGSSIIGLAAMEYLLFLEDGEATLLAFSEDENRCHYLQGLADYLVTVSQELAQRWEEEAMTFTNSTELSIDGGQNVFVNGLINQLDKAIRFRLRTPSGEETGEAADPTLVESPYAAYSLPCLAAGFAEWETAYYGGTDLNTDYGFDDYLAELGNTTVGPRIDAAISRIDASLASLNAEANNVSLQDLLASNPQTVQQLTDDFQALLVLMRVDLSSAIGVILTVTDADGD